MRTQLFLALILSCSSLQEEKTLSLRIQKEEVRSLQEIKAYSELLLSAHPELPSEAKSELRSILSSAIETQQLLKDEESRILQLLLKDAFRVNQLTDEEREDKYRLRFRLKKVYEEKSKIAEDLITKIVSVAEEHHIGESIRHDLVEFIGGFR